MYCPLCARPLQPVEREGLEIDHCPDCGGLWLDRGELDELIRREALHALTAGQERLLHSRRHREFDEMADSPHPSGRIVVLTGIS